MRTSLRKRNTKMGQQISLFVWFLEQAILNLGKISFSVFTKVHTKR